MDTSLTLMEQNMKTLQFIDLLEILQDAYAIQWDDYLVFPTVNITDPEDEEPTFEITTPHGKWLIFNQHDMTDCHIDNNGFISFTAGNKTFDVTILKQDRLSQ